MKYQLIPKSEKGQRFVIADIHGCAKTFKTLVQDRIKLNKTDQLFLLGDYINRGPDSKGVLDLILELKEQDFQIYTLRGNHEKQFLMAYDCGMEFFKDFLIQYNSLDLMNEHLEKYISFCQNTAYYFFTEGFFLSHCGIKKNNGTALTSVRTMFSEANLILEEELLEKYTRIHGHKINAIQNIRKAISNQEKNINLDSGCVYKNRVELGNLCVLNLDTFELLVQKNID